MKIKILKHDNEKYVGQIVEAVITKNGEQAVFFDELGLAKFAYNWGFKEEKGFEVIEESKHKETVHEKFLSDYVPSRLEYFCASILNAFASHGNINDHFDKTDCCKRAKEYAEEMIRVLDEKQT